MTSQAQLSAAQQLASGGGGGAAVHAAGDGADEEDDDDIPELEAPEDDGPVDETGVDAKDVDLVMAQVCLPSSFLPFPSTTIGPQVNCSRARAVKALKESGGDLINASKSSRHSRLL